MKQPLFPPTISTQLHFAYFLAVKAMVRKFAKSDGQTGSWCLDKAVLAQGGGGGCGDMEANREQHTFGEYLRWACIAPTFGGGLAQKRPNSP